MGEFLTAKSRIEQTETDGYWKLIDNEVYLSNSGRLTITPRRFWSEGYTIPSIFMPFIGDKNKYDIRPAHGHDLNCRFHEIIFINLSLDELYDKFIFKHPKKNIMVCKDIPKQYLTIEKISKIKSDNLLKEMMLSCGIENKICNLFRIGVTFNINWLKTGKKSLNEYVFYEEDIGLVNGL